MKKTLLQGFVITTLLAATPFQLFSARWEQGTINETFKDAVSDTNDYQKFFIVGGFFAIPVAIWAYHRYQEDKKLTSKIINDAEAVSKEASTFSFLDDLTLLDKTKTKRQTIIDFVNKSYPGYRFPFLSYVFEAEEQSKAIHDALWSITRRLGKKRPEDKKHVAKMIDLQKTLTDVETRLKKLIIAVEEHPYYRSEAYSRNNSEFYHSHANYGFHYNH